jgi:hypothetical protein
VRKQPSKRVRYGLIAFFVVGALGFLAGAVYAWSDEHGGIAGKAHVTHCESHYSGRRGNALHCDATWTYKVRTVTGYVENANRHQLGKTVSVRIHGTSHVTNTTYWVPIGLALFALAEAGVAVMVIRVFRRQSQAP